MVLETTPLHRAGKYGGSHTEQNGLLDGSLLLHPIFHRLFTGYFGYRMNRKQPLTKLAFRWRLTLLVSGLILGGIGAIRLFLSKADSLPLFFCILDWVITLSGIVVSCWSLVSLIGQRKEHLTVDDTADRELSEEIKDFSRALIGIFLIFAFVIIFCILSVRAFR